MPTYQVTLEDGRVFDIDADSEPTQSEIDAALSGGVADQAVALQERRIPTAGEMQAGISFGVPGQSIPVTPSSELQGLEAAKAMGGTLAGLLAPQAAAARIPSLAAPATSFFQWARNLGALGGIGGLASGATKGAIGMAAGDTTPGQAAKETVKEGLLGVPLGIGAGLLAQKAAGAISGAMAAGPGKRFVGAAAGLNRPLWQDAAEQEIQQAEELIRGMTGIQVPRSIGERLGTTAFGVPYIEIEAALRSDKGKLPAAARSSAYEAVAWAASRLAGTPALTRENVSRLAIDELEKLVESTGKPAREAIDELSDQLVGSLNRAIQSQRAAAGNLLTGTVEETPFTGMTRVKDLAGSTLDDVEAQFADLYGRFRSNPKLAEAKGSVDPLLKFRDEIESVALEGEEGPLYESLPEGLSRMAGWVKKIGDIPQSLERLRNFRTVVRDSMKSPDVFPGVSAHWKGKLIRALTESIDDALGKVPDSGLREQLAAANSAYRNNIDRFQSAFAKGVISDFGIERGTAPEAIYQKLTGSSGTTYLGELRNLLGDKFDEALSAIRDTARSEIRREATSVGGQLDPQRAFRLARQMPEEVFPEIGQLQRIAAKEAELAGIKLPSNKDDLLNWASTQPQIVDQFIEPGGRAALAKAVKAAAANDAALRNSVLADVARKSAQTVRDNPAWFANRLSTGGFDSRDVKQTFEILDSTSPETANLLRGQFMKDLVEKASRDKFFDPGEFSKLLKAPIGGSTPKSGGPLRDTANAALGADSVDRMLEAAKALETIGSKNLSIRGRSALSALTDKQEGDAVFLLARLYGMGAPVGIFHRGIHGLSIARYKVAAALLEGADDELLKLLGKPITELSQSEAASVSEAIRQAMGN